MTFSRNQIVALLTICGIWSGCGESSKRSTPPAGDALPNPTFSLGDWCQGKLKTEEQLTLDALISSVGATDCTEFEYRYANMSIKKISIAYEDLSDPAPLLALSDLEILSIRGNKFTNISWTKSFPALIALEASDNPLAQESSTIGMDTIGPIISELGLDRTGIKEIVFQEEPAMRSLALVGNGIEDLSFLTNETSLVSLHLDQNSINDLTALTQLEKLQNLSLASNPIAALTPLANLSSLKELNLGNVMLDITLSSAILPVNLEKLTLSILSSGTMGTKKIDVAGVASLRKLRVLDGSGRIVSGDMEKDSDLTELILEHAVISDFDVLRKFSNLQVLKLNNAGLLALPDFSKSVKLTTLQADGNPLSLIDGRRLPQSLRFLTLSKCSVKNIKGHTQLTNLTELSLKANKIAALGDFTWPVNLRSLDLSENAVSRLPDLSALNGLTSLNLARNQIRNVSALAALTSLEQLDLSHNQLELVAPLAPLTKLTHLDARSNGLPGTTVCPLLNANACLF